MFAKAYLGLNMLNSVLGIILDLSDFEYNCGDEFEMLFGIGGKFRYMYGFPTYLILGEKCQERICTLLRKKI